MPSGHNGSNWLTETFTNRPFIVGAMFLGTYFVPFLVLIGLALAYYFKRNPEEDWELSHFRYLIRTFWIAIFGAMIVLALSILGLWVWQQSGKTVGGDEVLMGLLIPLFVAMAPLLVFCGVRIVLSLMRAASHKPMPKPETWAF